jgi:hypothetical protein
MINCASTGGQHAIQPSHFGSRASDRRHPRGEPGLQHWVAGTESGSHIHPHHHARLYIMMPPIQPVYSYSCEPA